MTPTLQTATDAHIPGPRPMRIAGRLGNTVRFFRDPFSYLRAIHQAYGPIAAFIENTPHWVFALGPEYNRYLLTNPDIFYSNLAFLSAPPDSALQHLTAGLLSMNGDQHKCHRRLMMPLFQKRQVDTYRDDIVAITQQSLDSWPSGRRLDIARAMRMLTLRIVCTILLGIDPDRDLRSVIAPLLQWAASFTSVGVHLLPKDLPLTPYRRFRRSSEHLEILLRAIIAEKRANGAGRRDVLTLLVQAHDEDNIGISDTDLIGHANLLFLAGFETSANALIWTLFLLSQHPQIQADLLDELDGVLRGAAPTVEQLSQLPLLDRVVKESMRVLPPVAYTERMGAQPFELGPYTLPKGAYVGFSAYMTHHLPELYPEPERFFPDRWLSIDPSPYEYLPFGAGNRMCLGAAFAMLEIKLLLAMILQRYRLEMPPHTTVDYQFRITLTPKRELPMLVYPQDRQLRHTPVRGAIRLMVDLP